MWKDRSTAVFIIGAVLLAVVLLAWGRLNNPDREFIKRWNAAGVECLPQGHVNLAQHIHLRLSITEDETEVLIPANIGAVKTCMSEMHTHNASGEIHIESTEINKIFTLGQFFQVWGETLEKEGYALSVTADDQSVEKPKDLILKDLQKITIEYTK